MLFVTKVMAALVLVSVVGVLSARPDVNCALHVHTNIGMAIAGLKSGLRMVSQQSKL